MGLRIYFVLAAAVAAGISAEAGGWKVLGTAVAAGLSAVALLLLSVLVVESAKAPTTLRNNWLRPPGAVITGRVCNDLLHREWLKIRPQLEFYRKAAAHWRSTGGDARTADKALANLDTALKDFKRLADSATLDMARWKRCREARRLAASFGELTHEADFDALEAGFERLRKLW